MRVVLTPFQMLTHYTLQAPIAWAFRAAGHEVMVACGPALADAVTRTGMSYTEIGDGYDPFDGFTQADAESRRLFGHKMNTDGPAALTDEERQRFFELLWQPYVRYAMGMTDDLVKLVEEWRAEVLITDPWVFAGTLAARITGVPLIRQLLGPDVQRHIGGPGQSGPHEVAPRERWAPSVVELFDKFRVEPLDEHADALIDPVPERMQMLFDARRLPMQFVPYYRGARVPPWLREPPRRPRICVTWGTATGSMASQKRHRLPEVVESVARLDAEVVLAVADGDADRFGDPPGNVRVARNLPMQLLLPSCDAVVHQGGTGSTLTAVTHGVPQVIVPEVMDQPLMAASVAGTGAGVKVDPDDAATAGDHVRRILVDGDHTEAARLLQKEMLARPTPAQMVTAVEALVAERR